MQKLQAEDTDLRVMAEQARLAADIMEKAALECGADPSRGLTPADMRNMADTFDRKIRLNIMIEDLKAVQSPVKNPYDIEEQARVMIESFGWELSPENIRRRGYATP